jgi:hypothetical protein
MLNHQEPRAAGFDPIEFLNNSTQRPLAELLACLVQARKRFDPSGPDHGRAGVYQALLGIMEYFAVVIPSRPDLAVPLRELLYALRGLDNGTIVPLVQAVELDHRPPNPISQDLLRADAAVLMELKRQAGEGRKAAAETVARRLNRLGFRDGGQRIIGKRVAAWRDQMRRAVQEPDFDAKRYFWILGKLKDRFPKDPQAAFEFFLDCMTDLDTRTIPNKGIS